MRNLTFTLLFTFLVSNFLFAQLEPGSTAPDFTITDLDGNSHNLYNILDEGKPVLLDLFATWCGPCWSFAETGVFDELDEAYGVNGDNSLFTVAVEADPSTSVAEITNSDLGDWTDVIHYTLANDDGIADLYELAYYPTIYLICPDRSVTEVGQLSTAAAYSSQISACPVAIEGLNAGMRSYDGELVTCGDGKIEPIVTIMNMGSEYMTACLIQTIVDGDVINSFNWTGSLSTYGTDQVTLPEIPSNTSNVSFSVVMDGDIQASDDSIDIEIESATESHAYIHVEVDADYYVGETSWNITDAYGDIVFDGSYEFGTEDDFGGGGPDANMIHDHFTELSEGCYTFNVFDSYGDGQLGYSSSGPGTDGSITLTDGDGNELFFVSGNWESEASAYFEVTNGVGIQEVLENSISVFPNPTYNKTSVSLNLIKSSNIIIELVNTLGQKVFVQEYSMIAGRNTVDVSVENLNAGIYYLNVTVDDQIITEKLNILK